jgi:hypothetical protein
MSISNKLEIFWNNYDNKNKKKESQIDIYKKNGSNENILRFIKLGGGPALGTIGEQYAKYTFNNLKERIKGDTGHDHTIQINGETIKIEQKTSSLNKKGDFMWQHVAEKHSWDILLLMGIHYNHVLFYGMNKDKFKELVVKGKITNQGNKNKDSEQGMWFNFLNVKDDIIEIKTNEDFFKIFIGDKHNNSEKLIKNDDKLINKSKSEVVKIITTKNKNKDKPKEKK